ncbi:Asp-tRNA(Asn)/Glu-tRNA(Gln) amidotransferase subunit GatA [Candidatus Pacearchaeota archaeon]|nr:Asp-tRNA(Asn)/Glu-tRNA(Gln) amidotransferase subunit GatA [Candidatus Pacearchaeota archaeon]
MKQKTTEERAKKYLEEIERNNLKGKKINAILHINPNLIEDAKKVDEKIKNGKAGKLAGKIIAVKSNINVRGMICNCASRTLESYKAGYDAFVIEKIKNEDGVIIGMCNMDEFACGSSGETSAFGPCRNPTSIDRIPGGSSSGSAAAVAANFCDMALGSDTGGSIRNPASHCDVFGFKPSYGAVSRYGLIDLSMSLDVIGPLARNIQDIQLLFEVIKGKDERDATSDELKKEKLKEKIKIGIPEIKAEEKIWKLVNEKIKNVSGKDIEIIKIKLPHVDLAVQTYYPLCYTEFFSGTRKFDGRRFGKKIEDSCGREVLRRILGGSEITKAEYAGKFYRKALQVKELIKKEFEEAFKKVDFIILPSVPKLPHKIGEKISVEDMYAYDSLTIPANLAEIPAISIPAGKVEDIPVGMQVMGKKFDDLALLEFAKRFK